MKRRMNAGCWVALAALGAAACGGGDEAPDASSGRDTSVVVTDSAPSDPPDTDVAVTEPPTSGVTTDDPPSSEAPVEGAGDLDAFCGASEQFYVEATSLTEIGADDDAAARSIFLDMSVSVAGAIFNAPDDDLAARPLRIQELLGVMLPALDEVDYDVDVIADLPNSDELDAAFTEFDTIVGELRQFLMSECESDIAELDAAAVALAADVGTEGTPPVDTIDVVSTDVPAAGAPPVDSGPTELGLSTVNDDSGTISVDVPLNWTEVDGAPDGELRQLVAAPDASAFLAAFDSPGVIIIAGDAENGLGAEAGAAGLAGLAESVVADGCQLAAEDLYDDGVYVGTEQTYSCPGTDAVTRFAGGTNDEADIFWLLGVIHEPGDDAVWETVSESFFVD